MAHYLIVGNGAAGVSAAEQVRRRDPQGRITILTTEPYRLYSRPGIAYLLMGQVDADKLISRSASFYDEHRFDLRVATVSGLDLARHVAYLNGQEPIEYDVLLLATGSSAVPGGYPGSDLDGVVTLDTLDNARDIIRRARKAKAAVVVGGGITAMELVEGLRHHGLRVHWLQRGDRIWPRLLNADESTVVEHKVHHEGIKIHYNEEIAEILGKDGRVTGVTLKSGGRLDCQIVGMAIGVRGNLQLIRDQPIEKEQGILVNEFLQSNDPALFAAGDIGQVYDRWTRKHSLDVLWPSAVNTGRAAGYNMVEVAHGRAPTYAYSKGSPFNAALLFGLHLTVTGMVGDSSRGKTPSDEATYLSRGSSNVWTGPFAESFRSAWDHRGANTVRVALSGGRLIGGLLLGHQALADPLRELVENDADVSAHASALLTADERLPQALLAAWQDWRSSGRPRAAA